MNLLFFALLGSSRDIAARKKLVKSTTEAAYCRVAISKKIENAKFGHKQFQKRPNPEK